MTGKTSNLHSSSVVENIHKGLFGKRRRKKEVDTFSGSTAMVVSRIQWIMSLIRKPIITNILKPVPSISQNHNLFP
jgi:hypothetical protein